jgi:hypothetical protein
MRLMKRFVNVADANPDVTDATTLRLQQLKVSVADANPDVTDAAIVRLTTLKINVSDSVGVTDSVTAQRTGGALAINVADSIGVTDAVTVALQIAVGQAATSTILAPARGIMPVLSHPLMRDATIVWPLNEGTGAVAADYSGNRLNGIFNGSPLWVPSKSGHGVGLNADGSYVSVGTDEVFDQMAEFSFACWVYPEDINNRSILYIVGGGDYASLKISRIAGSAGYLRMFNTIGANSSGHNSATISLLNRWVHVAWTYDKNGISQIYLDGKASGASNDYTDAIDQFAGSWTLQMGSGGAADFNGIFDHFAVWNRALTADAIRELSRDPFAVFAYDYVLTKHYGAELVLDVNVADSNPDVTDAVTVQRTAGAALEINVADTISLTDSATGQLDLLKPSVADTLAVTDAVTARLDVLKINVADNIGLTDATTVEIPAVGVLEINVADTVGLTDSIIARLDLLKVSIADALTLTDAIIARLNLLKIDTSDSLTVSESAQLSLSPLKVSVGEAVGVSEGLTVSTTPLKVSVADTLGLSDSVAATIVAQALAIDVADAVGLTDSVAAAIAIYPMLQAFLSVKATESSLSVYATESALSVTR